MIGGVAAGVAIAWYVRNRSDRDAVGSSWVGPISTGVQALYAGEAGQATTI